eukprot:s242_g26.t1
MKAVAQTDQILRSYIAHEEFRASVWKRNVAFVVETQKLDELLRSFQGRGGGGVAEGSAVFQSIWQAGHLWLTEADREPDATILFTGPQLQLHETRRFGPVAVEQLQSCLPQSYSGLCASDRAPSTTVMCWYFNTNDWTNDTMRAGWASKKDIGNYNEKLYDQNVLSDVTSPIAFTVLAALISEKDELHLEDTIVVTYYSALRNKIEAYMNFLRLRVKVLTVKQAKGCEAKYVIGVMFRRRAQETQCQGTLGDPGRAAIILSRASSNLTLLLDAPIAQTSPLQNLSNCPWRGVGSRSC